MKTIFILIAVLATGQVYSMAQKSARHPHQVEFQRVILSLKMELEEDVFQGKLRQDQANVVYNLVMAKIEQNLGSAITPNTLRYQEADIDSFKTQLETIYQQALTEISGPEDDARTIISSEYAYELSGNLQKLRMYCYLVDHQPVHREEEILFSHFASTDLDPEEEPIRGLTTLPTERSLRESFYGACENFLLGLEQRPTNIGWTCINIQNKTAQCVDPRAERTNRVQQKFGIEIPRI